jgi:protein involved in polysaccharide export with SLBB domain
MGFKLRTFLAALAIALPLAACSGQGSNLPMLSDSPTSTQTAYRLGPGDRLTIRVGGADDMNGDYVVGDNGTVSMPLIGEVKAAGESQQQLEREISHKLAQGYIKDPKVSIAIQTYRPFYIYGEVAKPGEYPYASGMRVLNAIATAGGYTYRANQSYVVVNRKGEERKAVGTTPIQPDDIIKIPERYF